jgi:hypothetical protein
MPKSICTTNAATNPRKEINLGTINIQIRGSFGAKPDTSFSAMEGGHAFAITRAIQYLLSQQQAAIMLDHQLHADGEKPPKSDFAMLP